MTNKWSSDSGKLIKTFDFSNFKEALNKNNLVCKAIKFIDDFDAVDLKLRHESLTVN